MPMGEPGSGLWDSPVAGIQPQANEWLTFVLVINPIFKARPPAFTQDEKEKILS